MRGLRRLYGVVAKAASRLNTPAGPVGGGPGIIVTGEDLAGGTVSFGGRPATRHSCGPRLCTATAPWSLRSGSTTCETSDLKNSSSSYMLSCR